MHYAVQTGSTETIELLLFYNVDINLQDKVWSIVLLVSISRLKSFSVPSENLICLLSFRMAGHHYILRFKLRNPM